MAPVVVRRRDGGAPLGAGHRPLHWHLLSLCLRVCVGAYVFVWVRSSGDDWCQEGRTGWWRGIADGAFLSSSWGLKVSIKHRAARPNMLHGMVHVRCYIRFRGSDV